MDFIIDYRVEDYILNTRWEELPESVRQRALVCSVDIMTALLLGSRGMQHQAGVRLADSIGLAGKVPIVGSCRKFNFLGSTIAMSFASNSFDIDDGHNMIKGHPGTSFIGGLLAAALERDVSYKEYLTTLVVTYETTIRCALALHDYYGYFHSTGSYGGYGTAAAVGRLYRMSREQLNNALSVAEFHGPLVSSMRSVEFPSMNKDGVPFGAMVGALAVLGTLAGVTGIGNLLEMPQYRYLTDNLGREYEMHNLYFKPYTCCRWAHPAIDAGISLMREYGLDYNQIERVRVYTFDAACKLSKIAPQTADEAQYNIAYPVAAALVEGDMGYPQTHESGLKNPHILALMPRLEFVVAPELDAVFPAERLCRMEIFMSDGKSYCSGLHRPKGEVEDKVDINWISAKFHRLLSPLMQREQRETALQALTGPLERPLREIVDIINAASTVDGMELFARK